MDSAFRDVCTFLRMHSHPIGTKPAFPDASEITLWSRLIEEEYRELMLAIPSGYLSEIAKEGMDLCYVILGFMAVCGIDAGPVWDAVQRSNRTKTPGPKRGDGKISKGPYYVPPNIPLLLLRQPPLSFDGPVEIPDPEPIMAELAAKAERIDGLISSDPYHAVRCIVCGWMWRDHPTDRNCNRYRPAHPVDPTDIPEWMANMPRAELPPATKHYLCRDVECPRKATHVYGPIASPLYYCGIHAPRGSVSLAESST